MRIVICQDKIALGSQAADRGAELICDAIGRRGRANVVFATGASQFEMLSSLTARPQIDWGKINAFHLDEYAGISRKDRGSSRAYLAERLLQRLPASLRHFHQIYADRDPEQECARLSAVISDHLIDVLFLGIGENAHLAGNDPPADFDVANPYIIVDLDEVCRHQQLSEGWFSSMEEVPRQSITMSIRHMLSARAIICSVPDARKASAVREAVQGPIRPEVPASILPKHRDVVLYLDRQSSSQLDGADQSPGAVVRSYQLSGNP